MKRNKNVYFFGDKKKLSVHDMKSDQYYNLDTYESYILLSINGVRDIKEIQSRLEKEYYISKKESKSVVNKCIKKFKDLDWID